MEKLSSLLADLHKQVGSGSSLQGADSSTLMGMIREHVLTELDEVELELAASLLLLDSNTSLFRTLLDSTTMQDKGKKHVCDFLAEFCKTRHCCYVLPRYATVLVGNVLEAYNKTAAAMDIERGYLLAPLKAMLQQAYRLRAQPRDEFGAAMLSALRARKRDLQEILYAKPSQNGTFNRQTNSGLKRNLWVCTGLLFGCFPDLDWGRGVLDSALHYLTIEMDHFQREGKTGSAGVCAGLFSCLDRLFFQLSELPAKRKWTMETLLLKMLDAVKLGTGSTPASAGGSSATTEGPELSRYDLPRKCLRLIKNHAGLFRAVLGRSGYDTPSVAYRVLYNCHAFQAKAMDKHVEDALLAVLLQIARVVIDDKSPGKTATKTAQDALGAVLANYLETLNSQAGGSRLLRLTVSGLAQVAPAIYQLEKMGMATAAAGARQRESRGNSIITALLHAALAQEEEQASAVVPAAFTHGAIYNSSLSKTNYFLLAMSGTVAACDISADARLLQYLHRAVVQVVLGYPSLPPKLRVLCQRSLCFLAQGLARRALSTEGQSTATACLLVDYLDLLVPTLLVKTISREATAHRALGEFEAQGGGQQPEGMQDPELVQPRDDEDGDDSNQQRQQQEQRDQEQGSLSAFTGGRVQFSFYLSLWYELLRPRDPDLKISLLENDFDYDKVSPRVLNRLYCEVVAVLRRLDLSYESNVHDAEDVVIPNNLVDQDLLLNLSDFMQRLLKWLAVGGGDDGSQDSFDANASLLQWLPVLLRECVELSTRYPLVSALYRLIQTVMRTAVKSLAAGQRESMDLMAALLRDYFLRLEARLLQFSDELLEAALGMLLDAPAAILPLHALVPSLVVAFRSGLKAKKAVETLERRLFDDADGEEDDDRDALLPVLLPLLDSHLVVGGAAEKMHATLKLSGKGISSGTSSPYSSYKAQDTSKTGSELYHSILRLLGRLGGSNQYLLRMPQEEVQASLSWEPTDCVVLSVKLPLDAGSELVLPLTIDSLLPRIVELCGPSNQDEALRVTAAESLHAITLFMVGTAQKKQTAVFVPIYAKVFPAVIQLAASSGVSRTLFEKLLLQLVRWFSGERQVQPGEDQALFDSLFDGLFDEGTGGTRETCARALAEYYKWAVKQSSKSQMAGNRWMERLFALTAHPAEAPRMGAAIVLGRIYSYFREETGQVTRYVMQTVYELLRSMRLGGSPAFMAECLRALGHYRSIAIKRLAHANEHDVESADKASLVATLSSEHRAFPKNLLELVRLLWEGVAHPMKDYRRASQATFAQLCPLLVMHSKHQRYIPRVLDDAAKTRLIAEHLASQSLVAGLEGVGPSQPRERMCLDCPSFQFADEAGGRRLEDWLGQLSAALDAYIWLLGRGFAPLEAVFASMRKKRGRDELDGKDGSSVTLDSIASFAASCVVVNPEGEEKSGRGKAAVALLLLQQRVEERRQEALEKAVWFLATCLRAAAADDDAHQRQRGDGASSSGQLQQLLLKSHAWAPPLQHLILRHVMASAYDDAAPSPLESSGAPQHSSSHGPAPVQRSQRLPKLAEDLLSHIPLLEPDTADGGGFTQLLRQALDGALARIGTMVAAKDQDAIAGLARMLRVLRGLQRRKAPGSPGIMARVWGPDFELTLQQRGFELVSSLTMLGPNADPVQIHCAERCISLGFEMGLPVADLHGGGRSVLSLLVVGFSGTVGPRLADFLARYGDQVASHVLDRTRAMEDPPYFSAPFVAAFCSPSVGGDDTLLIRLMHRILCVALADPSLPHGKMVAAFVPSLALLPWNVVLLLFELDKKAGAGPRTRCPELLQFVRQRVVQSLAGRDGNLVLEAVRVLPLLVAGVVSGCARPAPIFGDDGDFSAQLSDALDRMVTGRFTSNTEELAASSSERFREFATLFHAYLQAFAACGSPLLLAPLLPSLRQGQRHKLHGHIRDTFAQVVSELALTRPPSPAVASVVAPIPALAAAAAAAAVGGAGAIDVDGAEALSEEEWQLQVMRCFLGGCLSIALDEFDGGPKLTIVQGLFLPSLKLCSSACLVRFFCGAPCPVKRASASSPASLVRQLFDLLKAPKVAVPAEEDADGALAAMSCALMALQAAVDLMPLPSLKRELSEAFNVTATPGVGAPPPLLHSALIKLAYAFSRQSNLPATLAAASTQAKCGLHSAALSCLCVTFSKTQSAPEQFDKLVFCPKDLGEVMLSVVGWGAPLKLGVNMKFERRVFGGFECTEQAMQALGLSLLGRKRRTSRRAASSGIMTQFAGTLVEQSSLSQSAYSRPRAALGVDGAEADDRGNEEVDEDDEEDVLQNALAMQVEASARAVLPLVPGFDDQAVELELKDFNREPVMVALVRAVLRAHVAFGASWTAEKAPEWLAELVKQLDVQRGEPSGRHRVRLFYLRLLMNDPVCSIARRWAQQLLAPVLRAVLEDVCRESYPGFHYFLRDVVFLLSESWAGAYAARSDDEVDLALQLLSELLARSFDEDSEVMRDNVRATRCLLQDWLSVGAAACPRDEVPLRLRVLEGLAMSPVLELLTVAAGETGGRKSSGRSEGSRAIKKRQAGLELFRTVLLASSAILEEQQGPGADSGEAADRRRVVQELLKATVGCVAFPRKEVCEGGGVVCGEVMRVLAGSPRPGSAFLVTLAAFQADVDKTVKKKFAGGIDSIAACLKAIVPRFPGFLDNQLFLRMTEVLLVLSPRGKYELLVAFFSADARDFPRPLPEVLLSAWPVLLQDLSVVVVGRGRFSEKVPFVQIYSLRILAKYAAVLSLELLEKLLHGDATLQGLGPAVNERASLRVREAAYDFLIALCTQNELLRLSRDPAEARAGEQPSSHNQRMARVRSRALSYLLKGVTDPDAEGLEELHGSLKAKAASDAAAEEQELDRARNMQIDRELEGALSEGKALPVGADAFLQNAPMSSSPGSAPPASKRRGIRRKVLDFFSEHYGLDRDPLLRLGRLMLRLFQPACSDQWLNYSSYLLLNLCKAHPDYTAAIFAEGLVPGQDFRRLSLDSASSRAALMASTPRFSLVVSQPLLADRARLAPHTLSRSQRQASSQLTQLMPQSTQTGDASQRLAGMLRGTQDVNWTQTQAGGLLPGQVRPAESQAFQREFGALSTQAYNEASLSTNDAGYGALGAQAWDYGDMPPPRFTMSLKQPARKRDEGSSALTLRELNSASQDGRVGSAPAAKKAPAPKRVVVYRQYRDGELPDILISHADVLQPLQALCLRDPGMASGFFGIVFQALYCEGGGEAARRQEYLRKGLLTMLESSGDSPSAALVAGLLGSSMLCARGEVAAFRGGDVERGMPLLAALPSGLVAERGLATLNLHAGIALLEEKLIALRLEAEAAGRPEGREAQGVWRDLARLYEALGDRDVMLNLAARMSHDPQTSAALDCELRKDFSGAGDIYDKLRAAADAVESSVSGAETSDDNDDMRRLWDARALECKRQLCDWNALLLEANRVGAAAARKSGRMDFENDDGDEEPSSLLVLLAGGRSSEAQQRLLRDRVLPYYVQGVVGACTDAVSTGVVKPSQDLAALVDLLGSDNTGNAAAADTRRFLESRHAAEVATAFAVRGDWGRVRSCAVEAHSRFLETWASLHACAWTARRGLLQGLSRVAELEDAAAAHLRLGTGDEAGVGAMVGAGGGGGQESWDAALAHRWRHSRPSPNDPLFVWDALATGRCVALRGVDPVLGREAALSIADLYRRAASATVHQGVLQKQLVLRYVSSVTVLKKTFIGAKLNSAAEHCVVLQYNRRELERALLASDRDAKAGQGVKGVLDRAFSLLDKWTADNPPIGIDEAPSALRMCDHLEMTLRRAEWNALRYHVSLLPDTKPGERADPAACAREAADCFQRAAEPTLPDSEGVYEGRRALALREAAAGGLVRLCEDQLQRASSSEDGTSQGLAAATIAAYLSGLALGSAYCRDHVLQLFHLLGRHPQLALQERAAERLAALPAWIFLGVSPTLFGRLDKEEGPLVVQVLERVAAAFPDALHYQFRVTQAVLGRKGQALVPRLKELLRSPSVDALVEALEHLHNPELRFRDGMRKLEVAVSKADEPPGERDRLVRQAYAALKASAWPLQLQHIGNRVGLHNEAFAAKMRKVVQPDDIVGPAGEHLLGGGKPPPAVLSKLRDRAAETFGGEKAWKTWPRGGRVPLLQFSGWLADFDGAKHRLEVPGQYLLESSRPPEPARHSLVVSFGPELLIMGSKQRPKRLTVRGSGGRESRFLVKCGEDLRNDERIEALFELMNAIVGREALGGGVGAARGSNLRVRTYGVTPMSPGVGLLEWVSDTTPLKQIITEELQRDGDFCSKNRGFVSAAGGEADLTRIAARRRLVDEFAQKDVKLCKSASDPYSECYHLVVRTAAPEAAARALAEALKLVPLDVLRRRLLRLAPSPEVFLTLRSEMARSVAMISVCGYMLGLGDRHLDNMLLDCKTGAFVPIDFGMSFGIGTACLPVPELIPFRLTAVMTEALQPLDGRALVRQLMAQALGSLRSDEGAAQLRDRLEVYVTDPVLDWTQHLAKDDALKRQFDADFVPRKRIEAAGRKLAGRHPCALLLSDLADNGRVRKEKSMDKFAELVLATVPAEVRDEVRRCPERQLSPLEQVDALIALATDPSIVARQYHGLSLWL